MARSPAPQEEKTQVFTAEQALDEDFLAE